MNETELAHKNQEANDIFAKFPLPWMRHNRSIVSINGKRVLTVLPEAGIDSVEQMFDSTLGEMLACGDMVADAVNLHARDAKDLIRNRALWTRRIEHLEGQNAKLSNTSAANEARIADLESVHAATLRQAKADLGTLKQQDAKIAALVGALVALLNDSPAGGDSYEQARAALASTQQS